MGVIDALNEKVLFERFDAPRAFLAKRAALSAYAHGFTTAVVLDVGASHSCCAVVADGRLLAFYVRPCSLTYFCFGI